MRRLAQVLAALALLLLAAHDLRRGDAGRCVFFLGLAGAAFSDRGFVRWALAAALAAGAFLWTDAGLAMIGFRRMAGAPFLRLGLIMAGVLALDLTALGLVLAGPGRAAFPRRAENAGPQGAAFVLVAGLLFLARAKSPLPVLLLDRYLPGWGGAEILLLATYAAWLTGKMLERALTARVRGRYWSLFSAVFFGQLLLGLAGMDRMLMTGTLHLPVPALILGGPLFRGEGFFMPVLFGCALLLVGPGWCGHLCYIGAWDDRLSRLSGARPRPLPAWSRHGRAAALVLTVVAALGLRLAGVSWGPAALLAGAFGLGGVAVMVGVSRKYGLMAHCATWCPMGLLADALGKISPWRLRIGAGCDRCGRCSTVCRYGALSPGDIESGRPGLTCSLCGDCLGACKNARIGYRFPGLSPEAARRAYFSLVVALHAVFLGVARI